MLERSTRSCPPAAALLLLLAALIITARGAAAKPCGDDVDGVDVPCACGDVVVSNLALGDDPVSRAPCAQDGLIVRAPDERRSLLIDLRGHTLRGSGNGAGIRVVAGGPGGARIVSSGGAARISGFLDGIAARGPDTVAAIEDVQIGDVRRDGMRVSADAFVIRRCQTQGAARDGFSLGGRGFAITATRAVDSGRYGYVVMGQSATIGTSDAGNVAERSRQAGFNVMGTGHTLSDCEAQSGGKTGLHLQAAALDVRRCRARANAGDGIAGVGNGWHMADNVASDNGGDGIAVRGVRMQDAGGNRGTGNGGAGGGRPPVQCEIGGVPCAS